MPCYFEDKGIKINNQLVLSKDDRNNIFKELAIQELLL
jgi:hypothetical protein